MGEYMPGVRFGLTGPDSKDFPAHSREGGLIGAVTGDVAVKLGIPEFRAGLRSLPTLPAAMAMPESAMDENDLAIAREHDVRVAGKVPPV